METKWWLFKCKVRQGYDKVRRKIGVRKYDIDDTLKRIEEMRDEAEPGTDEFRRLAKDYEQELQNKKLAQELCRHGVEPAKVLAILAMLVIAGFGFALDMDSPKGSKIATSVINIFRHSA